MVAALVQYERANALWLALLERTRARNSLEAFRRHCLFALIEAGVDRARRAASTRRHRRNRIR
jgi:hypothetical protein